MSGRIWTEYELVRLDLERREAHVRAMAAILGSEVEARARAVKYLNRGGPFGEIERLTAENLRLERELRSAEDSIHALMTGGSQ